MISSVALSDALEADWDTIIIGAGMGGSAAAFRLSEAGYRVLVVERGRADFPEAAGISAEIEDPEARLAIGRWPSKLSGDVEGQSFDFFAPLGAGAGGSTMLYAAALDRFRPVDFAPRPHPDGGTLAWPYGYDDLAPHYARAEALLEVSGTADPLQGATAGDLSAPPAMEPRDAYLFERFCAVGLHPYRLHAGCRFVPGCASCLGKVCLRDCKRHGGNAFLAPALETGQVSFLGEAEVLDLVAGSDRVDALRVRVGDQEARLRARTYVLAAGTYFSPVLLLQSTSAAWPEGLGNTHDQVGRHLMFHTGRSLAVWARRGLAQKGPGKSIVFRDLYDSDAGKFGEVQSTGAEAAYGNVVYALRQILATSRYARVPLLWHLARIPAFVAAKLLGNAAIFELIMEDLPYPENRVILDKTAPSGMRFQYTIRDELRSRFETFSKTLSKQLKGMRHIWLTHGTSLNYGHPMGTCRLGDDPATSVADVTGRVHGVQNLYVADGSALTSSGGTNPSLTIAAHGLKTAGHIADRLEPGP